MRARSGRCNRVRTRGRNKIGAVCRERELERTEVSCSLSLELPSAFQYQETIICYPLGNIVSNTNTNIFLYIFIISTDFYMGHRTLNLFTLTAFVGSISFCSIAGYSINTSLPIPSRLLFTFSMPKQSNLSVMLDAGHSWLN